MFGSGSKPPIGNLSDDKSLFLEQAKAAREERAQKVVEINAAIKIQARIRTFCAQRRFALTLRADLDKAIGYSNEVPDYLPVLRYAVSVYPSARRFMMFLMKRGSFSKRFECLCKYILYSLSSDDIKMNYLSVISNREMGVSWIEHIKALLTHCLHSLTQLQPDNLKELRSINTVLTMLVSFTSTANWKILAGKSGDVLRPAMNQLCTNILNYLKDKNFYSSMEVLLFQGLVKTKPCIKAATLTAICTLLLRINQTSAQSGSHRREFLLHVLSVPAVIYHINTLCNEMYVRFIAARIFTQCLSFLRDDDQLQAIAVTLESNRTVCLVANLLQLGLGELEGVVDNTVAFNTVINKLLLMCGHQLGKSRACRSHWHPLLGWAANPFNYNDAVPFILKQLELLWNHKTVSLLFSDMIEFVAAKEHAASTNEEKKSVLRRLKSEKKALTVKGDSSVIVATCSACQMYQTAISVLIHMQTEMLAGLAFNESLLRNIWLLLSSMGNSAGSKVKVILDSLAPAAAPMTSQVLPGSTGSVSPILTLFCDAAIMLFMILDDVEMYEVQKPFTLDDLIGLSDMLNHLVFRLIWQDMIDWKHAADEPLFSSAHALLQLLHERDCRRQFAPPNHWIIKDVRPAQFISSIDKGNKTAQFLLKKMPHIVGHKDRIILFRKLVMNEKISLGIADSVHTTPNITYITITRRRLLEDGYSQLSGLSPLALKGLIRVRFVNAQGLDEAGIDQDGVFKEFLEETIKKVFDPSLNLFKITSEQKLYPSPTSSVQENHLALFEFVGRILGKAVYEGIVVEVPFAPFFLTQVLDNMKNSMYSYLDELPSLDPELYKNLTYVKHYEGDIEDLDLNFSYDEDIMGKLENYELKTGGRAITVTNENKISYVHYMARFKMHTRIREQTKAFMQGFRSIVNYEWLQMFSTPEVQKLISGDTVDIDLADLRKHTQYYGGFHNNHRVINWLWDVLEKDYSEKERGQFLKFITSCSKPPLLGFAQLEPPFSIRCVEVSDDQDTGDTIGSVLKGFFSIRRSEPAGRLPTSSTCFNLLKLPNYSKKRILKEKLRYSILNNTGFELS